MTIKLTLDGNFQSNVFTSMIALLGFDLTRQLFRLAFVNLGVGRWLGMLNEMDMRMREEFWSKLILKYVHISWVGT